MKTDFINQVVPVPFETMGDLQLQLNEAAKLPELRDFATGIAETIGLSVELPS